MTYFRALEGLRGISILLVMCAHTELLVGGCLGVDIFFVLSGFLIALRLSQEWRSTGTLSFKNFYLKRILKIFPVLFLVTLTMYGLVRGYDMSLESRFSGKTVLSILACFENWAYLYLNIGDHLLAQTWSLSVEGQFYLVFPVIFYFLLNSRVSEKKRASVVCFFIALSIMIKFLILDEKDPHSYSRVYYGTDTRMDAIFIGVLASLLSVSESPLLLRLKNLCIGRVQVFVAFFILLSIVLRTSGSNLNFLYFGGFTFFASAAAILILNLVDSDSGLIRTFLEFGPLVWLGKISYSLYVVHFVFTGEHNDGFMNYLTSHLVPGHPISSYTLVGLEITASILLASLCYYGVEKVCVGLYMRKTPN